MYQDFAQVYDALMQDVDYAAWADYYMLLLRRHDPAAKRIVECGCGTGALTQYFAKNYSVIAIDSSDAMLQIAYEKLQGLPLRPQLSLQDMRGFRTHGEQDAVLATCDAVNYLLTEAEVMRFFQAAYRALKTGGLLLFDVSSRYKLFSVLPAAPWVEEEEHISYIWQNEIEGERLHMHLSIFVQEGELYRRINEEQTQTCLPTQRYRALLSEAGFGEICVYGDQSLDAPAETEHRLHISAVKR